MPELNLVSVARKQLVLILPLDEMLGLPNGCQLHYPFITLGGKRQMRSKVSCLLF